MYALTTILYTMLHLFPALSKKINYLFLKFQALKFKLLLLSEKLTLLSEKLLSLIAIFILPPITSFCRFLYTNLLQLFCTVYPILRYLVLILVETFLTILLTILRTLPTLLKKTAIFIKSILSTLKHSIHLCFESPVLYIILSTIILYTGIYYNNTTRATKVPGYNAFILKTSPYAYIYTDITAHTDITAQYTDITVLRTDITAQNRTIHSTSKRLITFKQNLDATFIRPIFRKPIYNKYNITCVHTTFSEDKISYTITIPNVVVLYKHKDANGLYNTLEQLCYEITEEWHSKKYNTTVEILVVEPDDRDIIICIWEGYVDNKKPEYLVVVEETLDSIIFKEKEQ